MRRGELANGHIVLNTKKLDNTMSPILVLVLVVAASAYPSSPYWMNSGRSSFAVPQRMAMPAVPPQFFPNRALSFSGYFTGSGTPYRGQWAASRQNVPYYFNDGSSVSAIMNDDFESTHGYNVLDSSMSMDGSGLLFPGGAASSGAGRVDNRGVSTSTAIPDPEINTIGGASEEPTTTTAAPTAEPEPTSTTTTTTAPPPPISPAASEPAGASAQPPPPLPPQHPKRKNGGRSKETPPPPQDDDDNVYGTPTINAWFPFVFGGSGGANPNRAFNDDTNLTPTSYGSRPQYGRDAATSGHSPVAIANSFSTGRNAMAHSVATAYASPPPNFAQQQKQKK